MALQTSESLTNCRCTMVTVAPSKESSRASQPKPKVQPRYHVMLWDDNHHTFLYVIRMMRKLFGHNAEQAKEIARQVDMYGSAICLTTTKEHAELKREQIHAYGRDDLILDCVGSMYCSIEPES